jgi:hypothetical protein
MTDKTNASSVDGGVGNALGLVDVASNVALALSYSGVGGGRQLVAERGLASEVGALALHRRHRQIARSQ